MRTQTLVGAVGLRIHSIVQQNPGIHFRGLCRAASLTSTGQLRHHLDRLARRGIVSEVADGRYRRYFPASHASDLQPQLARLSRPLPRRIVRLLTTGPQSRTAMRRALACPDSTLGYHLHRMLAQGDLVQQREVRGCSYALADPERVRRILAAQESALPEIAQVVEAPSLSSILLGLPAEPALSAGTA
ncbi:MAG: winged helix-turn-helix transcriptional regulator [Thermoplasmatota archaeon]|nr:hypothetical protein [Halobacteriales archaeon]